MADQTTHDVVNEVLSMGGPAPIDVPASSTQTASAGNGPATKLSTPAQPPEDDAVDQNSSLPLATEPRNADQTTDLPNGIGALDSNAAGGEKLTNGDLVPDASNARSQNDGSAGSDTDNSKNDGSTPREDTSLHARSNSIKKPISFKKTSATKNFLAKNAVVTPPQKLAMKLGGQSNTATPQGSKPRLVAKSGSGSGSSMLAGLSKMNGTAAAPQNKVWNKNQPTAPSLPKQYTDEELKHQYGIHLADRLRVDESGKESTWADLDDDEDDWAPESMEWLDGTKSTVVAPDSQPPVPEEKETEPEAKNGEEESPPLITKPTMPPQSSRKNMNKTILKPGAHIATAQAQSASANSAAKGNQDRPSLVAKPSAIAPVSPWAALPPIEKVSPVIINPMMPPLQQRPTYGDAPGTEAHSVTSPAREIAPDDFNRAWREDRSGKELYNSQSGRYEPVNDMRRNSRQDASMRHPSVLQRPHANHSGPAEPSAAFQTSRSGAPTDGPWDRRRTSSNVSAGSLGQVRRMSMNRQDQGPLMNDGRQVWAGSKPHSDLSSSPAESHRQLAVHPGPMEATSQSLSSPQAYPPTPGPHPANVSAQNTPQQSEIARQQQLMKEKLERARQEKQRRMEQEEKEEVAKKERLRRKMEALAPKTPLASTNAPLSDKGTAALTSNSHSPVKPGVLPHSPPKPPMPTAAGEIAQYGLIKVHQPQPLVSTHSEASASELSSKDTVFHRRAQEPATSLPSANQPLPPPGLSKLSSSHPASTTSSQDRSTSQHQQGLPKPSLTSPSGQWQAAGHSDDFTSWAANPIGQGQPGNVWGPPTADRALGNGAFDTNYHRTPGFQGQSHSQGRAQFPPPGMMPSSASLVGSQDRQLDQQHGLTPSMFSQHSSRPASRTTQQNIDQSFPREVPSGLAETSTSSVGPTASTNVKPANRWAQFVENVGSNERHANELSRQALDAQGAAPADWKPVFKQTFSRTNKGQANASKNVLESNNDIINNGPHTARSGSPALNGPTPTSADPTADFSEPAKTTQPSKPNYLPPHLRSREPQPTDNQPSAASVLRNVSVPQPLAVVSNNVGRSSRFFPKQQAPEPVIARTRPTSPPPFSPNSHPVFDGEEVIPKISLPIPRAVVNFPPMSPTQPTVAIPAPVEPRVEPAKVNMQSTLAAPIRVEPAGIGAQPIVRQAAWQDRFNDLLGKRSQPAPYHPFTPVVAVAPLSKSHLDPFNKHDSTTVALPGQAGANLLTNIKLTVDNSDDVLSRHTEDLDALLQTREFGSTPTVSLSKAPHGNADLGPIMVRNQHVAGMYSGQSAVVTSFEDAQLDTGLKTHEMCLRLQQSDTPKMIALPRSYSRKHGSGHMKKRKSTGPRDGNKNTASPKTKRPGPINGKTPQNSPRQASNKTTSTGQGWRAA